MKKQKRKSSKKGKKLSDKKLFIIVLLCIAVLAVITTGSTIFNSVMKSIKYRGDIVSFSFHYGSYNDIFTEYDIINNDGDIIYTKKGYGVVVIDTEKKINPDYLDRIDNIVKKYNVSSWDGFDESDNDIMDGTSFDLKIRYENGATIDAHGYMEFPKNFSAVESEFAQLFEEIGE